jgi:hypothetical protein
MERKIGEKFKYEDKTLKIIKTPHFDCSGCYFRNMLFNCRGIVGECFRIARKDKNDIIAIEIINNIDLNGGKND